MIFQIINSAVVIVLLFCICLKIYARAICAWCKSYVCLEGKTAIVTGGSSGIGYHIVCGLALRGCKVIVADKLINKEIKNSIQKETRSNKIFFEYVDLASFKSIREFADRIKSSEKKIDILIHNAGIAKSYGKLTEDGLNGPMQINYYSAFLMTHLLVEPLKKSPAGRIIFASSGFAFCATISIDKKNPNEVHLGSNQLDYHNSKFCMITAADSFAEKLQKFNITSNSYHPGVARTKLIGDFIGKGMTTFEYFIAQFVALSEVIVGKSPAEGAQTPLYLACSNEVEGVTGTFFGEACPRFKPFKANNKKLSEAIWSHSEKIVQLKPDEILQ